jgi:hypothetical protein
VKADQRIETDLRHLGGILPSTCPQFDGQTPHRRQGSKLVEQLIESIERLLLLADASHGYAECSVCDCRKTARFINLGDDEFACEDCVKSTATLAMEHAKCSVR